MARDLADAFCLTQIVDGWNGTDPVPERALVLTSLDCDDLAIMRGFHLPRDAAA